MHDYERKHEVVYEGSFQGDPCLSIDFCKGVGSEMEHAEIRRVSLGSVKMSLCWLLEMC